MKVSSARFLLCLFSAIFINPIVAYSAEEPSQSDNLLQLEIEDLLNVNVSIGSQFVEQQINAASTTSLITKEKWQSFGSRRLSDAIGHLPGVIVLPTIFGGEMIFIRGFASLSNGGSVATLWDGVAVNLLEGSPQITRQNIQLGTLDRIEMIRGPGSALYGENAFHGVMALHSFDSNVDTTRLESNLASNEYYDASLNHSQAFVGGLRLNIAAAVSGQPDQDRSYDYISSASGDVASSERDMRFNNQSVVIKLKSDPNRDLSYYAGFYYDKNLEMNFYGHGTSVREGSTDYSMASRDIGGVDSTFTMLQSGGQYKFNTQTQADLKLYYINQERIYDRSDILNTDLHTLGDEDAYGANFTLKQSEFLGHTQWSLNLGTRKGEMGNFSSQNFDSTGAVIPERSRTQATSGFSRESHSIGFDAATFFGDGQYQLRYGGRYNHYSDFGNATSPRLGFIYHHTPDTAIKLQYGRAFRAPSPGEVRGFPIIGPNPDLKPETIDTYELVFMKQTLVNMIELTFFRSEITDTIITGPPTEPGLFCCFINSGTSGSAGAEVSYTYQASPWLLALSGSYVESIDNSRDTNYDAFPKWIFNAGIGYKFYEQNIDVHLYNRVHLDATEGQVASTLPDPGPLKDYWRTDLQIAKHWNKDVSFTLDIRNLFNRDNFLPSVQSNPSIGGIPGEPFSVMLGFRAKVLN